LLCFRSFFFFKILGVYGPYTVTKKVVGVFVRFRCAASLDNRSTFSMALKIRPSMVQLTAMVTVMAMDTATVPIQTAMMMKEKLKQLCKKWS
jgi:hypothetical protein